MIKNAIYLVKELNCTCALTSYHLLVNIAKTKCRVFNGHQALPQMYFMLYFMKVNRKRGQMKCLRHCLTTQLSYFQKYFIISSFSISKD